jgi:hypothetical protein
VRVLSLCFTLLAVVFIALVLGRAIRDCRA